MIILTGNSLNERHRELNNKVNEAATQGVLFEDIKLQTEQTDVDRIFKINLAHKHKNVEYIIETLKCGDSLYITKALKCSWLYAEEFSNTINPDYLEKNVFPEMSFKMKKKFLTMISMHVIDERAASFYTYCNQIKLPDIAFKFLLHTNETFKIDVIKGNTFSNEKFIALIGNSFTIADTVLETRGKYSIVNFLKSICHLYSLSNVEYLDLVEKYIFKHELFWDGCERLGLRISKHIIKNHKGRILRHTLLYINMLNKSMLAKYSSLGDLKYYATRLLPEKHIQFWSLNFYNEYKFILEIIPFEERLQYIKHIYNTKYPGMEFEMDIHFYHAGLYNLMTKEERESWALKHVASGVEHLGTGKDYLWYKFVSLEKALPAIKKYILVATDADVRSAIVRVLVSSAQSDRELETLFNYYYERHVNEITRNKELFVSEVLHLHKYFNFDSDCWNAFDRILHSMDVYDNLNASFCQMEYKFVAIIYAIIHEKELHIALKQYIDGGIYMYGLKQQSEKLPGEKEELVYQYLLNFYLEKVNNFNIDHYDKDVEGEVRKYILNVLDLMFQYGKPKEDIPERVMEFINLNNAEYYYHLIFPKECKSPFNQSVLVKDLKKDASQVVSHIPLVRCALKDNVPFRLNTLLRKLRIYFSTDVAAEYVELFKELLILEDSSEKTCDAAIYGLLQLTQFADRIDFVAKHIPMESKIEHDKINRKELYIRKAICKVVCFSRPVVPLPHVQKYIIGDYSKFCMPMIQSYAANLQPAQFTEFVKILLKSPASIQKHGIRLAFRCFSIEDMKKIILDIWKNTKNVSLRLVLYKAVYNKITNENDEHIQIKLFEAFNKFSLEVCEDDDDEFLNLLCTTDLPSHVLGEHILSAWRALNTLPDKKRFNALKPNIINNMAGNVHLMQQDKIQSIISEHITSMLIQEQIKMHHEFHADSLIRAKWYLTAKYLVYFPNNDVVEQKLQIVQSIVKACIKLWGAIRKDVYVVRVFLMEFIKYVQNSISYKETDSCVCGIKLLEQMLKELEEALPFTEVYEAVWSLRLSIIVGNLTVDAYRMAATRVKDDDKPLIVKECVDMFAVKFANLLNEFIEQGKYYVSAYSIILRLLTNTGSLLLHAMPFTENGNVEDVFIVICSKLVEIERVETYYFALDLLPILCNPNVLYRSVIDKIKSFDNDEIKHFLYRKLVCDNNYKCQILNGSCS